MIPAQQNRSPGSPQGARFRIAAAAAAQGREGRRPGCAQTIETNHALFLQNARKFRLGCLGLSGWTRLRFTISDDLASLEWRPGRFENDRVQIKTVRSTEHRSLTVAVQG